jgi:hypothetical protein
VDLKFFYQNNQHSYKHEVVITSFTTAVAKVIELPDTIEICLYPLEENVYGGIDRNRINRIGINYNLSFDATPYILVHELIHVNQKHLGYLKISPNGMCHWHGIPYTKKLPEDMTFEEYTNLPWEMDVQHRQKKVLQQALEMLTPAI